MSSTPPPPLLPDGHLILVALDNELPLPKLLAVDPGGRRALIGVGKINAGGTVAKWAAETGPVHIIMMTNNVKVLKTSKKTFAGSDT